MYITVNHHVCHYKPLSLIIHVCHCEPSCLSLLAYVFQLWTHVCHCEPVSITMNPCVNMSLIVCHREPTCLTVNLCVSPWAYLSHCETMCVTVSLLVSLWNYVCHHEPTCLTVNLCVSPWAYLSVTMVIVRLVSMIVGLICTAYWHLQPFFFFYGYPTLWEYIWISILPAWEDHFSMFKPYYIMRLVSRYSTIPIVKNNLTFRAKVLLS